MAGDIDREGVEKAYGRWAPVYDLVFGKVFDAGRQSTIAEADKIGGGGFGVCGGGEGLAVGFWSSASAPDCRCRIIRAAPDYAASIFPSRCCAGRSSACVRRVSAM